jgi:hypothetical protein
MRVLDLSPTDIFYTRAGPWLSGCTAGGTRRLVGAIRDVGMVQGYNLMSEENY